MSTCHSLRRAGVRALLNSEICLKPFLSPSRLSSFCAYMMVDFPSRCTLLRGDLYVVKFYNRHSIDYNVVYNPYDLTTIAKILANSPNIKSLTVDVPFYLHLTTLSRDFCRSFRSLPFLETLAFSNPDSGSRMIDIVKDWEAPALRTFRCLHGNAHWPLVQPFFTTIRRLELDGNRTKLSEWRVPLEQVKDLFLYGVPWGTLPANLPRLFPGVENFSMSGIHWDIGCDESACDNLETGISWRILAHLQSDRSRHILNNHPWTHLKSLCLDLHTIYALCLRCSVDKLVIETKISHTAAHTLLVPVTQMMGYIQSLTFNLMINQITQTEISSLEQTFQECDFTETSHIALRVLLKHICHATHVTFSAGWSASVPVIVVRDPFHFVL
ncbi:hypothetical protein K474DRAFT_1661840 [Panus rudis PR-1116 ss-1]|nr:hypothetical protein K474DRAFT_1661840 [Panus rudis PR-1116 ss-1]